MIKDNLEEFEALISKKPSNDLVKLFKHCQTIDHENESSSDSEFVSFRQLVAGHIQYQIQRRIIFIPERAIVDVSSAVGYLSELLTDTMHCTIVYITEGLPVYTYKNGAFYLEINARDIYPDLEIYLESATTVSPDIHIGYNNIPKYLDSLYCKSDDFIKVKQFHSDNRLSDVWELKTNTIFNHLTKDKEIESTKKIDARSEKTYLKIIRALALHSGVDLSKPSASEVLIQQIAATHQVTVPTGNNTISRVLTKASQLED